jgi:hypothetical protein
LPILASGALTGNTLKTSFSPRSRISSSAD